MKNKLVKLMGVVLTLAILSGLLMMAAPVSAATQSWSTIKGTPVVTGTSANVFDIAADGKTIYMYTNYAAATALAAAIDANSGPATIEVDSVAGFAASGSITIGSDTVTYTGADADANTFTGVGGWKGTTTPTNAAHAIGDAVVITSTDAGKLQKSLDGGQTWSATNLDTGSVITGKAIKAIKIDPGSASDLIATDGVTFYRSTNSARTFGAFTLPADFDPESNKIYNVDVAEGENGIAYLAATDVGVFLYDSDILSWVKLGADSWGDGPALAAAFSPNYTNVQLIVGVTLADGNVVVKTISVTNAATSEWGNTVSDCVMKSGGNAVTGDVTTIASIAFPSSYSSTNSTSRVFIGLGDTNSTVATSVGVYRINGSSTTTGSTSYDLGENVNVSSLAYHGTASNGILAAGVFNDYVIKSTTNVSSNSPTWTDSTNSPFGQNLAAEDADGNFTNTVNMFVKFAPGSTTLYAGASGLGSGLAMSTDYMFFPQISMISTSSYAKVAMPFPGGGLTNVAGKIEFQILTDAGTGANMIFKSVDTGATWQEIYNNLAFNNGSIAVFMTTPGDKDFQTLWIQQAAPNADKYIKSSDGGANWDSFNFPSIMGQINAMSVIDANNFWMGSSAGIRSSTSTAIANIDGKTPLALINIPGFFVILSTSGETYVSSDSGVTFTRLGNIGQFTSGPFSPPKSTFAFNGKNWTLYCVDVASGNILKWVYGVDNAWTIALEAAKMPPALQGYANISGISIGPGGVWYVQYPGTDPAVAQLWRAVDPLNPNPDQYYGFEGILSTSKNAFGGSVAAIPTLTIIPDANGIPTYYTRIAGPTTTNNYGHVWESFTDVLITSPKVTAPMPGATVGTSLNLATGNYAAVDFAWAAVNYSGATYGYQVAYDNSFTNLVGFTSATSSQISYTVATNGTSATAIPLAAGRNFFFRVKVLAPMMSKWSDVISFNTMIASDVNPGLNAVGRISPENGASGITLTPAITWGAVTGATYDFKLATDAAFTNIIETKDGLTATVFSPSKPLTANTVYFWEVRANVGGGSSAWVVSAFTTAAAGGGTQPGATGPAPVITVQPPAITVVPPAVTVNPPAVTVNPPVVTITNTASTTTPAYIWIIIVIGAVLVIAVIVLIARTRRV